MQTVVNKGQRSAEFTWQSIVTEVKINVSSVDVKRQVCKLWLIKVKVVQGLPGRVSSQR